MGMVVNNNIPALFSFNAVTKTGNALQKSIQKLSTGLRINSAADDAAGLAISEKMRAQIRGLDRAVSNSQDGISMIQTAEGALNETHSILQRMRELSVQSANDTLTQQDRGYIQLEIDQLREEITRIGNTTQFNKKKLLNGDAAVLWSSDNLLTKAIVNGGLRQVDQFGQKKALEGNYKIDVTADAGEVEVKKTDIFKVKHKDVVDLRSRAENVVKNVKVNNLKAGVEHTVKVAKAGSERVEPVITGIRVEAGSKFGTDVAGGKFEKSTTEVKDGRSYQVVAEVVDKVDQGSGAGTPAASITVRFKGFYLDSDGTRHNIDHTQTFATGTEATAGAVEADLQLGTGGNVGLDFSAGLTKAGVAAVKKGDKIALSWANAMATATDGKHLTTAYQGSEPAERVHHFTVADSVLKSDKTVNLQFLNLDSKTGEVLESTVSINLNHETPAKAPIDADTAGQFDEGTVLAQFKTYKVGDVARGNVALRDLDKFWDAQGRFMLTDPQSLTLTKGDGTQAKVTLYANDTLNDVARKLNDAIASDNGLGQGKYVDKNTKFVSFIESSTDPAVEAAKKNTLESVNGTFVIRTVTPGSAGKVNFSGDEDIIKALSLNVIQEAKESVYSVDISDAHTGKSIVTGATTTGNRLIGVLHPNIDVEFDAMAGLTATWNDTKKNYVFNASKTYSTVLHLADNTTVFQIGANEGEDMGINIGDMRSHALGLNEVLVTDRASAARSITIIDNAIDKVSTQRAKLGAYQNRLEHTINNLTVAGENLTAAESRIRDTDMAKEMMNFTKLNIMLQAGNAMLAQANQLPQNVLSLIR